MGSSACVNAAHQRGLAVLLDVVYNHFGPVGNYTGKFGPYVTSKHRTPWGDAVNFEGPGSDQVRRFFCDNALMWMRDYHIDGLRLDAITEIVDRSAIHFLEQLSTETEALSADLGRSLVLIAESDLNDPRVVTPREAHGYGLDAQWSDDFHHALFTVLHSEPGKGYYQDFGTLEQLAKSLTRVFVYDGAYSPYRRRHHGRPVEGLSAHRFLGYIQNHDQVGNRAIGDRVEHIVGMQRAKVAAALVFTAPFVPMLFQGEEFAASTPFQYFADHDDPKMAKSVSEGRRREFAAFGWDPASIPDPENPETFRRSKLNWEEIGDGRHAEMLEWYRKLIHLRRNSPSLNDGDLHNITVAFDEDDRWLTIDRKGRARRRESPLQPRRSTGRAPQSRLPPRGACITGWTADSRRQNLPSARQRRHSFERIALSYAEMSARSAIQSKWRTFQFLPLTASAPANCAPRSSDKNDQRFVSSGSHLHSRSAGVSSRSRLTAKESSGMDSPRP